MNTTKAVLTIGLNLSWLKRTFVAACLAAPVLIASALGMSALGVSALGVSVAQTHTDPDTADPAGLKLDVAMSYLPDGDILLFYVLNNIGNTPFIVKPSELKIYYGAQEAPYEFTHSPPPGLANQLSQGETEFGSITVVNPPVDSHNLQLVWPLVELETDAKHTLLRQFDDIILNIQGVD